MRVLFLTQYFPPESGAPQGRLFDLAWRLKGFGHQVTVLTALPNYPRGEVFNGYRGRLLVNEQIDGLNVIRTWVFVSKQNGFVGRLATYFSFMASSALLGIWKIGPQEVTVVESPPLFLGLSGLFISFIKRSKLIFNVSDLWPASAVALGVVRNSALVRLATWLEEFIYLHSDAITGQTQGIVQDIHTRFPQKPVVLITNGVDVEAFSIPSASGSGARVIRDLGLDGRFVVGYAGLHGLAQGLETVIEAARILLPYPEIVFTFFGDGPEKSRLVRRAEELHLTNTRFYPTQPRQRMPDILAGFDVSLIPLKRLKLFTGALPSKMFEAMAAGVPLILSVDGEARSLLEAARAGLYVEPENSQSLADGILHLYRDPECRKQMGRNGREYVVDHYDRRYIAKGFEQLVLENL